MVKTPLLTACETEFQAIKTPELRDLAWVLFSPSLIEAPLGHAPGFSVLSHFAIDCKQEILAWLKQLEQSTGVATIPKRGESGRRLGKYFETLLRFIFMSDLFVQYSGLSLRLSNFQITENKTTKGELDFVLSDNDAVLTHLEAAVKFYLLDPNAKNVNDCNHWIGPNAADRLKLKMDHMASHQLKLSSLTITQNALTTQLELNPNTKIIAQHIVKGMLFTHWKAQKKLPQGINAEVLHSQWIYRRELEEFVRVQKDNGKRTVKIEKLQWLVGEDLSLIEEKEPATTIEHTVAQATDKLLAASQYLPVMLSIAPLEGQANLYSERVIVVEDYWPATSSPSRKI